MYQLETLEEDAFFGSRKRRKRRRERRKQRRAKRRSNPKVIARREKRRVFGKKLGQAYRDIGGATAIGSAIDTLVSPIEPQGSEPSKDFEIGLLADQDQVKEEEKKNNNLTIYFVVGGILVAGIVGVYIYKKRKS